MWRCVEACLLREACSGTVCAEEGFCEGAGAAFAFCAGDVDDVQVVYIGGLSCKLAHSSIS